MGEKLADNGTVSSRLETNTLALAELLGNRSQDRHTFKSLTDKVRIHRGLVWSSLCQVLVIW